MNCKQCNKPCKSTFCYRCAQRIGYLDKYPILHSILSNEDIEYLKQNANANGYKVSLICMKCKSIHSGVDLSNFVKRLIKDSFYQCHACSKIGKTDISVDDLTCIDRTQTIAKYGHMPVNVKKDKVVALCSVCGRSSEIKVGSILHQIRRRKLSGKMYDYRCFACGTKRQDAIDKQVLSNKLQLTEGHRSGLEVATANILDSLADQLLLKIYP